MRIAQATLAEGRATRWGERYGVEEDVRDMLTRSIHDPGFPLPRPSRDRWSKARKSIRQAQQQVPH